LAYAGTCKYLESNSRPLVSFVYLNLAYLDFINESANEMVFTTILHEMIHTLGFSSSYLGYFYDRENKISRKYSDVVESSLDYPIRIKSPLLKSWVNEHLVCNEDLSVPLENVASEGSMGSHFEASILGNELMNPSAFYNTQYTGAITAYIDSMGFFKSKLPKDKMDETLVWGYKAGCDVLRDSQTCESSPMTCKKNGFVCSTDHFSIGFCRTDHLNIPDPYTN
jgi:Leishmanolysin